MSDQQLKKCIARLHKEISRFNADPQKLDNILLKTDPTDILVWYFVIKDLDEPYKHGVYMGKIEFPKTYPFKPPVLRFLTPNGRFQSGVTLCTSFSHFHSESWSPNWTAEKMVVGLISMMFESAVSGSNDAGMGGIVTSDEFKHKLAVESMDWNMNNQIFKTLFASDFFENKEEENNNNGKEPINS